MKCVVSVVGGERGEIEPRFTFKTNRKQINNNNEK
jgi:hypothetical protein